MYVFGKSYRFREYSAHEKTISFPGDVSKAKNSFVEYVKAKRIPEKMLAYAKEKGISSIVLQGEWSGEGIQKNRLKLKTPEWFVFTARIDDKRSNRNPTQGTGAFLRIKRSAIYESNKQQVSYQEWRLILESRLDKGHPKIDGLPPDISPLIKGD